MSLQDITLPEVQALPQHARFFHQDKRDFVEISTIGSKDTVVKKVGPEIMARFRDEWIAYCDQRPLQRRPGVPLTDIMDEQRAEMLINRHVHNLNELAKLSDMQCQNLGHGTQTLREAAKKLMMQREAQEAERARKAIMDASAAIGPKPADVPQISGEMKDLSVKLDQMNANFAALIKVLTPKADDGPPDAS